MHKIFTGVLVTLGFLKGAKSRFAHLETFSLTKSFKFVVCNRVNLASPSLTILVPLWFITISLVFLYLSKLQFSGFLPFKVIL